VRLPGPASEINAHLLKQHGIIGGYDLGRDDRRLKNHMLVAVTEVNTRASIDRLVAALSEVAT
jgi:glycine cleavage system P protein (glycine dehydrogenase) subunit 1